MSQRLDATGAPTSTDAYDAWGNRSSLTASAADPFGYNAEWGYVTDQATGLILCTHRYYDPSRGRWLTRDPIGYAGGANLYAYCDGNPVARIDQGGLLFSSIDNAQGAAEMAGIAADTGEAAASTGGNLVRSVGTSLVKSGGATVISSLGYAGAQALSNPAVEEEAESCTVNFTQKGGLNLWSSLSRHGGGPWRMPFDLRYGDRSLYFPFRMDYQSDPEENFIALTNEMAAGQPIYDSWVNAAGELLQATPYLEFERQLLQQAGWVYNSISRAWMPP